MAARALMFDFNGTLSDDEPLLFAILSDLFAEQGTPLSEDVYYERLAGLSDPEIVPSLARRGPSRTSRRWSRSASPATARGRRTARRSRRRRARPCSHAAGRVPVAVVSGAHRDEVVPALAAAGLAQRVGVVVTIEDVERGKPDPAGYLLALELLGDGLER